MASLGYQSFPPTDLGRVDEEMASPDRRFLPLVHDLRVLITVLYDSLWFINENVKKGNEYLRSLLEETETSEKEIDQERKEPDGIMNANPENDQ
ncbi:hypothetical protein TNCV_2487021 [Trichonephila clavipes]|uniref:Uncharacterized protein n=1 Tax=Trichonephila clavipes TaxID=2585209 RepID=A0A8X6VZQ6_TRICX|nr:hypothetical protein TNCV_2487021 [Trichonephila clavipes]